MPDNRSDKEAALNNLARLFALAYVEYRATYTAMLRAVRQKDFNLSGTLHIQVEQQKLVVTEYEEQLTKICKELGYAKH